MPSLPAFIFEILLFGTGCLVMGSCAYLLTLAGAGFLHRQPVRASPGWRSLAVLVPAHDEEALIGRCLDSLSAQTYPAELVRVLVIADNCSDRTADVASAKGVEVMVRTEPDARGKGRALRWALDQLLDADRPPDAVVMIDADSVADAEMLSHLEAELEAGAEVVQSDYRILDADASSDARLVAAGFLLFHRARFTGRAALHLPANIVGNGVAFTRDVLRRVPWSSFTAVEDLEYSLALRLAGVRPRFASRAVVYGPIPSARAAQRQQRMRWEGGRLFLLRTFLRRLLVTGIRRRDWAIVDAGLDLAILPTGLLALATGTVSVLGATAVVMGRFPLWALMPWLISFVALPAYALLGLAAAGAPPEMYRALLSVPRYLVRKLSIYATLAAGFDPDRWESTTVGGSADLVDPDGDGRAWIGGVPVDVIDMPGAVDRVMKLTGRAEGAQVCTINLDFIVSAQTDPAVSAVLRASDLNLADGVPVSWLARLNGHRLPRVAGADIMPLIVRAAAERGAPVFFVGGQNRAAEKSATRLRAMYPALAVAGFYEPPKAPLEDLPSTEMARLIRESGAKIVFVGLGHPKQERWIAENRSALGSSVAIGVGGSFDFIAAHRRRAPRVLRQSGFEWAFRLSQEPRRLLSRYARDAAWMAILTVRALRERRMGTRSVSSRPA